MGTDSMIYQMWMWLYVAGWIYIGGGLLFIVLLLVIMLRDWILARRRSQKEAE